MIALLKKNALAQFDSKMGVKRGLYAFLNPYSYLFARENKSLFNSLQIFIDGEYLSKFLRFFCGLKIKRNSFDMTSMAPNVFNWCISENKSIAFVGAKHEEIREAVGRFQGAFPKLKIIYYRNGYFTQHEERKACLDEIVDKAPDIVVVGMGTPLQEQFLVDLWHNGWRGAGFTCGGFFHQTAKRLDYYPAFFNRFNLRWVYRIYDEPKLFRRYFVGYPKFVLTFIGDWIGWLLSRQQGNG